MEPLARWAGRLTSPCEGHLVLWLQMAFNGDTGDLLYRSANLSPVARYQAPIVVAGTVYVVSNTSLYAFRVGTTGPAPSPDFGLLPIDLAEFPADLPDLDDESQPPGLAISPSP